MTALSITTSALLAGRVGVEYAQTLAAAGGTSPYTFSLTTGTLPAGLALATTGALSGTPTTSGIGTAALTFTVTDHVGATALKSLPITVAAGAWKAAEDAILAWFQSASGLASGHVLWGNQRTPNPARPYAKLKRTGLRDAGGIGGELSYDYSAARAAGKEIVETVVSRKSFTVSCIVYSDAVVGDDQETLLGVATRTAAEYAEDARTALSLPTVVAALGVAGIASWDSSPIRDIPEQKGNLWLSRAELEVTFGICRTASDSLGYLERVTGTGTFSDPGRADTVVSLDSDL